MAWVAGLLERDASLVRLGRFPKYVGAVVGRARALVAAAAEEAVAAAGEFTRRFFEEMSPWARVETDLAATPATVSVRRECGQLADGIVLALVTRGAVLRQVSD